MPYPTNLIKERGDVALDLRPHWWYFSRNILTGIPLLIMVILVLNTRRRLVRSTGASWVVVALVVAWAVWLGLKYLQWAHDVLRGHQPARRSTAPA